MWPTFYWQPSSPDQQLIVALALARQFHAPALNGRPQHSITLKASSVMVRVACAGQQLAGFRQRCGDTLVSPQTIALEQDWLQRLHGHAVPWNCCATCSTARCRQSCLSATAPTGSPLGGGSMQHDFLDGSAHSSDISVTLPCQLFIRI